MCLTPPVPLGHSNLTGVLSTFSVRFEDIGVWTLFFLSEMHPLFGLLRQDLMEARASSLTSNVHFMEYLPKIEGPSACASLPSVAPVFKCEDGIQVSAGRAIIKVF